MNTFTPSDSQVPDDLVELGRVSGAYGIQGWLRIHAYSDSSTLLNVRQWWLKPPASKSQAGGFPFAQRATVSRSRMQGDAVVARLADVSDRTHAETLKGWTIWVSRADFAPLEPDEYYWVDLVGCLLYGESDGQQVLMGQVEQVTDNGAHGILHVVRAACGADGNLEFRHDAKGRRLVVLVPFVSAHVHTVDLENKRLLSNWPVDA